MHWMLFLVALAAFCEADLSVTIENGGLRGKYMTSRKGRQFRAFLGVPYAKAPVGDLRFQSPRKVGVWKGVRDATKAGELCFQADFKSEKVLGSEDCLYLNVYAPKNASKLPVMMFVHGGAYFSGSGSPHYYGPEVLLDQDVVLVVVEYRVGALGFLATGDMVVPGNNGLKDLIFALKWIQRNIRSFGGNPGCVTIFGHSSGGSSIYMLTLSPLAKGLFHAAIIHSGSGICDWSLQTKQESKQLSKKLAANLKCPTNCTRSMVNCFRKIPVVDLVKARTALLQWHSDPQVLFKPAAEVSGDGAMLPDTPVNLLKSGRTSDVPIIIGNVEQEGSMKAIPLYLNPKRLDELDEDFNRLAFISLRFTNEQFKKHMPEIRKFYFGDKKISKCDKKQLINMYTDGIYLHCSDEVIRLHRKYLKAPIYRFLLGYQGQYSYANYLGAKDRSFGVTHSDDMQYLFTMAAYGMAHPFNKRDGKVADFFTERWANFARHKEPKPCSSDGVEWKPVSTDAHEYLYICGPKNIKMKKDLAKKRLEFWNKLNLSYY